MNESETNGAPATKGRVSVGDAAVKGALAGLLGGAALLLVERLEQRLLLPRVSDAPTMGEQAVQTVADSKGAELSKGAAQITGAAAQLGFCALMGAICGVIQNRLDVPPVVEGLMTAGVAYAASMSSSGILPKLGATSPPLAHSLEETAVPVGAYLAYGVTTAAAARMLNAA